MESTPTKETEMTFEELIAEANRLADEGNALIDQGLYADADALFVRGLELAEQAEALVVRLPDGRIHPMRPSTILSA